MTKQQNFAAGVALLGLGLDQFRRGLESLERLCRPKKWYDDLSTYDDGPNWYRLYDFGGLIAAALACIGCVSLGITLLFFDYE